MYLNDFAWQQLANKLQGRLLRPGDAEYGSIRKRFVARSRDVLPEAVARCATRHDVVVALSFAQSNQLPFAIRSGGHSYADYSSTPGLLVDMSRMDSVAVKRDTVVAGPGATVELVAQQLAANGRLLPCGSCPTVGIGGIGLVGGFGLLGRVYGLTTDHLLCAQVVLADGTIVTASCDREPDLYWALRGGGGANFGVVTSLVLRTHPALPLANFYCMWPLEDAVFVIDGWQHWAPNLADAVTAELTLIASDFNDEEPTVEVFGCSLLSEEATRKLLGDFTAKVGKSVNRMHIHAMTTGEAARYHAGLVTRDNQRPMSLPRGDFPQPAFRFLKSEYFFKQLPSDAIQLLVEHFSAHRSYGERRELEFVPWGGAYGRVPSDATAFVHREPQFLVKHSVELGPLATEGRRAASRRWLDQSWEIVHPYGSGRVYQGFPDPFLRDWIDAYYGSNVIRLKAIKAAYDPREVFSFAQSIPPAEECGVHLVRS